MPTEASFSPPTADRYAAAFRAIITSPADGQVRLLRAHYHAPQRTVTAKELARLIGYTRYSVVNAQYGRLARLVGEQLDYNPEPERLGTLVLFQKRDGEWHWLMRPEVAHALETLGWLSDTFALPDEVPDNAALVEGAVCRVTVNAYERNPEARRQCIETHGTRCCICGFDFGAAYGPGFTGFIHVHHVRPLSEIRGEYVVNPVGDLCPICPNCHSVVHHGGRLRTIDEMRQLVEQARLTQRLQATATTGACGEVVASRSGGRA